MPNSTNSFNPCCLTAFQWDGTPVGREESLAGLPTYVTGQNDRAAVLYVHDALGWQFGNARLLADHYARELTGCLHFLNEGVGVYSEGWRMRLTMQANVTVYIPDFFAGEVLDPVAICEGRWADLDMDGFKARNRREVREPEIFAAAREIRSKGYSKVGAVGFCFGGWAVLRLAAVSLVDAIVCAHPSWVTNEDLDGVHVPVLFLAPEKDHAFSDELKEYAFRTLLGKKKVPFEWVHFPGVEHGCLTKGDEKVEGEREAMVKGKAAAVRWWAEWLG